MKTKTRTPAKKAVKKTTAKAARPASRITKSTSKSSKESLEDIFEDMLKDIYWAENHLSKALPKMAKAAYNEDLKEAFEGHLKETKNQISRLEQCFSLLGMKAQGKKCAAMQGLVEEGQEAIDDHEASHARDAALIGAAQKVEHYEISSYGTLRTMATVLGKVQCAELLEATKDEEAATDEKLTRLSEKINKLASTGDQD
jgi:ferritin-like metal-binding protein YciE